MKERNEIRNETFVSSNNLRGLAALFALAVLGGNTSIQAQQAASELKLQDAPATYQTRVNLVMVPVVVRDKNGRAIGDLKEENFQLSDRGKPQVILKFSMERQAVAKTQLTSELIEASRPATAPPERFLAYVFDDLNTRFAELVQARMAAEKHFREALTPATRAAVYTTSGQTMLDFTGDRDKLFEALGKLRPRGTTVQGVECPEISPYMAEMIVSRHDNEALRVAIDEAVLCAHLDSPEAVSAAGAVGEAADSVAKGMAITSANRVYREAQQNARITLSVLKRVVGRLSTMPGNRSMILLSSGFLLTDRLFEQSEVIEQAIRSGVTIHAVDARGLWAMAPGGDASQSMPGTLQSMIIKDQYARASKSLEGNTLGEFAHGTAGTFVENTNDLVGGLNRIAAPPEFHYLLAFSPQNLKVDEIFHPLKVTIKDRKGLTVQARHGYYAPKTILDPAKAAQEELREALFSREELSDIPVDVSIQFFKASEVLAKLSVIARVDIRQVRFRKAEDRNLNTVIIVSGVFDRNGNYINGVQKKVEFRLRDATLESLMRTGIRVKSNFDVPPGHYTLRLVVRDFEAQAMAARNSAVDIP